MKIFYLIENGQVVGFRSGTDRPGDPTSTKVRVDAWVAENTQTRQVVVKDAPPESQHHSFKGGEVIPATPQEVVEREEEARAVKQSQQQASKDLRDSILAKLTDKNWTPLSQDEAKWLTHRLDLDA